MPERISAVIVYYRTPAAVQECIAGLRSQEPVPDQIVVVDNSACEGAPPPAVEADVDWFPAARNLGFGAACNAGAQRSDGRYLLLLNADLQLRPDAVSALANVLDAEPRAGIVGPRIYGNDGRLELSARRFPSLKTGIVGRASMLTRAMRRFGRLPADLSVAASRGGPVDWVSGACMLVRREAFEQVSGFDQDYWMYWEDADLCKRMLAAGWSVHYQPAAEARHRTGSSGRSARTIEAFHSSAERYFDRHLAGGLLTRTAGHVALRTRKHLMLLAHRRRRSATAPFTGG